MKRAYGGVTVDLDNVVWVFDIWAAQPIFHRRPFLSATTICGMPVHRRSYADAIPLPPKHAVRIGRPCARCWPELRRQLAIPHAHPRQGAQLPLQQEANR